MHNNIYINIDSENRGYAPGLALGRCVVNKVSHGQLLILLWHEDLLFVLLNYFLVFLVVEGDILQLVIYMNAMMVQKLITWHNNS